MAASSPSTIIQVETKSAATLSAAPASNKTLATVANLAQLLPTGTVFAFQALAPSFSNRGTCDATSRTLTLALIALCAASAALFSLTDSFTGRDGRQYYGLATRGGFYVFNYDGDDGARDQVFGDLKPYWLRATDYVHAFLAVLVFMTVAFSDGMIQGCLFPAAGRSEMELLVNLPLGAGVLSTLVFLVFPTRRRGIGYTNAAVAKDDSHHA
ncbi:protein DMP3-like [Zingiber officinale]|uniref:DUF679 domain membrane protein 2 n=1 Tax=Zingiber officinale TaxID=94328 RepID=A0A8J5HF85_ZINOF|nr:protein DMP3-like [Zingiber officinale]KAG6525685.1 hypothetical protein ZIOFF_015651 [Zingiber officinale]